MTLDEALRKRATDTALLVAERLREPRSVARIAEASRQTLADGSYPAWRPDGLWGGHAGISVLYARLSHHDDTWSAPAHAHLSAAASAAGTEHRTTFAGAEVALAASLFRAARGGYTRLLSQAAKAAANVGLARARRTLSAGQSVAETGGYDVITGLSGQGRILLLLAEQGFEDCAEALNEILRCLVPITEPVLAYGTEVPGWWTSPDNYPLPDDRLRYPRGDFNIGLAHGIAGPLALFAIAQSAGHDVDGLRQASEHIVDWLLSWQAEDRFGPYWPSRISFEDHAAQCLPDSIRVQTAWCYGTPGTARAIQLAGQVLGRPELSSVAAAAMCAAVERAAAGQPRSSNLCHGVAGLLHVASRIGQDAEDGRLARLAAGLTRELIDRYDETVEFGYQESIPAGRGYLGCNDPGLLQGASGIALALHTAANPDNETAPHWDAPMMLT
ncbi:lanthionine synthetase C family protein [Amycolatopsis sp. FU40]|uniref:lanthionine synthetase C family protein n=1 Tax=Amycolatopsis sp. FU40 TaxID=2914159 RepID=UPI001F48D7E1|nr:lanthionine synthetase C family protein [Amycolatopsis sp. FU40]UKD51067.1 lanthionine synthetase C family protein [Amycolatopsis sp. FU40]